MRLAGRSAIIVGGTGGIGRAIAARFLREGARLVVTGLTDDEADEARGELSPLGPVAAVSLDARDPSAVDHGFTRAQDELGGRLDILVHVAGISGRSLGDGPLHDCTPEGWSAVLEANANGPFLTNRAAVRLMREQAPDDAGLRGTVLNLGSVLARHPSPRHFGTIAYAASKGAIESLTLAAAAAYAPEGIRFNLLAPALIRTPMSERATGHPEIMTYLATKQPMAGGPGGPSDCVEAALFLCEPATRFLTGVILHADGGWRLADGQIAGG